MKGLVTVISLSVCLTHTSGFGYAMYGGSSNVLKCESVKVLETSHSPLAASVTTPAATSFSPLKTSPRINQPSIIHRLLLGEHIYPQERERLGITRMTRIRFDDLVQFLAEEICRVDRFPPETEDNLSPLYEGMIIAKVAKNRFVCTSKRTLADNPNVIAEQSETVFSTAEDAARFFLKWDFCLPGRLDGIVVE